MIGNVLASDFTAASVIGPLGVDSKDSETIAAVQKSAVFASHR